MSVCCLLQLCLMCMGGVGAWLVCVVCEDMGGVGSVGVCVITHPSIASDGVH